MAERLKKKVKTSSTGDDANEDCFGVNAIWSVEDRLGSVRIKGESANISVNKLNAQSTNRSSQMEIRASLLTSRHVVAAASLFEPVTAFE